MGTGSDSRTSPLAAAMLLIVIALLLVPLGIIAPRALALAFGQTANAQADPTSDQVGATAAQFRVDESGAATYSVPIYGMPGTAGVMPALTLSYSSQGGYGAVGKGWSIGGLSTITRCRATRESGDFIVNGAPTDATSPRPINYTESDRYCLDGQRLILAQADNAACPTVSGMTSQNLRTEIDSFQRVCGYSTSGATSGPSYFTVERKDGSTSWYGDRDNNSTANRPDGYFESTSPAAPAAALSWAQTRFQDSTGNYIDFTYLENPAGAGIGEHLVSEIRYTGKTVLTGQTSPATAPYAKIVFNYSARPQSAWGLGYASGGQLVQTRRLDSISSVCIDSSAGCVANAQARFYQLNYNIGLSGNGQEVLTSLQECRDSSRSVCLRPTNFYWSAARNEFGPGENPENLQIDTSAFRNFKLADVNGDGRQDFVYLREGNVNCATDWMVVGLAVLDSVGRPTYQFQAPLCLPARIRDRGEGGWHMIDYNGDGRDDLFVSGAENQAWLLFPSNGASFDSTQNLIANLSPSVPSAKAADDQVQLADLNGDGLTDIIYPAAGELHARVMTRMANGFGWAAERLVGVDESTIPPVDARCAPNTGYECTRTIEGALSTKTGFNQLADFNGDSASDVLIKIVDTITPTDTTCTCPPPSTGCQPFSTSNGQTNGTPGYLTSYRYAANPSLNAVPCPGQNGPLVRTALHLLTVRSLTDSAVVVGSYANIQGMVYSISYGDVNADGLTDIFYRTSDSSGWSYRTNTGAGMQAAIALPTSDYENFARFADVNGDGRTDMLQFSRAGNFKPYKALYALPAGGFSAPTAMPAPPATPGEFARICDGNDCNPLTKSTLFGDLDGDGALDFVSLKLGDNADVYVSRSQTRFVPRDVITSIVNGITGRTDISYAPLTNKDIYRRQSGSRDLRNWGRGSPVMDFLAPSYVVSKVTSSSPQSANAGAVATLYYRYANAKAQSGGRGYLGFQKIDTIDVNQNTGYIATTTSYAQYFPFIGVPVQTIKRALAGQVYAVPSCLNGVINDSCFSRPGLQHAEFVGQTFSESNQLWAADSDVAGSADVSFSPGVVAPLQVRTLGTEEILKDTYTSAVTSKVLTTFTYGAYGNVTQTSADTYSSSASTLTATIVTDNSYAQDSPALWRLGRLTTSIVTHSRPNKSSIARRTDFEYSTSGPFTGLMLEERTEKGGAASMDLRKRYTYDDYGNRTSVSTCSADIATCGSAVNFHPSISTSVNRYTAVSYGASGRYPASKTELFWNGTSSTPVVTQTTNAYDLFGQAVDSVSLNGGQNRTLSGDLGRAYYTWNKTEPNGTYGSGSGVETVTTYRWCTDVSCPSGAVFRQKLTTTASATEWAYFDALSRPVMKATETFNKGVSGKDVSAICTDYDAAGKALRVSNPFFLDGTGGIDGPGAVSDACGSIRRWTVTSYNVIGLPLNVVAPDGSTTSTNYNGLTTLMWDQRGKLTTHRRNGLGEVVETIDPDGLSLTNVFDAAGNVTEVHRDGGRGDIFNQFLYDKLGRKTSQQDPDAGTSSFGYNAAGELVEQIDALNTSLIMQLDGRGRVWKKIAYGQRVGLSRPVETTTTTNFDSAPNGYGLVASESVSGRYGGSTGPVVDFARNYSYDSLGRAVTINTVIDGTSYPGTVQYDFVGRPYKVQDASAQWAKIEYNGRGPAAMCFSSAGDSVPGCDNTAWQRTSETDAWGHTVREVRSASGQLPLIRTYNQFNGRLEALCGDRPGQGGDCDLINEQYRWDLAGNLTSHQKEGRYLEGFEYDNLSRLKLGTTLARNGVTDSTISQEFNYDLLGNLCQKKTLGVSQDYSYLGRSGCGTNGRPGTGTTNQFGPSQVGSTTNGSAHYYNAKGSLTISDASGTANDRYVAYNVEGKPWQVGMESSSSPSVRTRFWYGSDGQRYKAEHSDLGETVLYIGSVEIQKIGATTAYRRNIGDFLIQRWVGSTNSNYFLWHDHLGSLVRITDPLGAVTDSMDFSAFGERRSVSNPDAAGTGPNTAITRKGFTGHEQFARINIVHMNGRIYDPSIGRFMQADPLVQSPNNAQSWNSYTYGFNNPYVYTDPTGNFSLRQFAAIVIGVAAAALGQYYITYGYYATAFGVAVAGGFAAGYVATGSLRGGIQGAFTAALTFGVGLNDFGYFGNIAANGFTGGILETLQGGKFGSGFASAGLTAAFIPHVGQIRNNVARTLTGAIVGGSISDATGGKFANGAIGGAIQAALSKNAAASKRDASMRDGGAASGPGSTGAPTKELDALMKSPRKQDRLSAAKAAIDYFRIEGDGYNLFYDDKISEYALTNPFGDISLGDRAFASWSDLGVTLGHEIEVHWETQFKPYGPMTGGPGSQEFYMREVQADRYELWSAERFGLTGLQMGDSARQLEIHYGQLSPANKDRVNIGIYEDTDY